MGAGVPAGLQIQMSRVRDGRFDSYTPPPSSTMITILVFFNLFTESWQWIGPEGGFITDLEYHQQIYFASTYGNGLYKSANGIDWTEAAPEFRFRALRSIGSSPGWIIVGMENNGLWRSTDHGASWHRFTPDTIDYTFLTVLIKGDTVIGGTLYHGIVIFIPPDRWENPIGKIRVSEIRRTNPTYTAATDSGLYRSADGIHWSRYPEGQQPPNQDVHSLIVVDTLIYVGTEEGVYFAKFPLEPPFQWTLTQLWCPVLDFTASFDTIFAASQRGVFYSLLGTPGWSSMGEIEYPYTTSLQFTNERRLVGTTGGIFRYENGWVPSNYGMKALVSSDLEYDPDKPEKLIMATSGSGLLISTDFGLTWGRLPTDPFITYLVDDVEIRDAYIYLLDPYQGVIASTDGGGSFHFIFHDSANAALAIELHPIDPKHLIVAAENGVFHTTDAGETWMKFDGIQLTMIKHAPDADVIIGANGNQLFRSIGYTRFHNLRNLPSDIVDLEFDFDLSGTFYLSSFDSIYLFWCYGDSVLPVWDRIAVSISPSYTLLTAISTYKDGVWLTPDASRWIEFNTGFPHPYPFFLDAKFALDYHRLYGAGTGGFWTYLDSTIQISVTLSSDTISPDGDADRDSVVFFIDNNEPCGIRSWHLSIGDSTILDSGGTGNPPNIAWYGYNRLGIQVPNGNYDWRFECWNNLNHYFSCSGKITVRARPMVSGLAMATEFNFQNKIVVKDDTIHVFYTSGNPPEIYHCYSTDGNNWTGPFNRSNSRLSKSDHPVVAIDGNGFIHLVWEEENLLLTRSSEDWDLLDTIPWSNTATQPSLMEDGGDLLLFFVRGSNLFTSRYSLSLKEWQWPKNVKQTGGLSRTPSPTRSQDGTRHLVFADNTNGSFEIWYTYSTVEGEWQPTRVISSPDVNSIFPDLAGEEFLYATWLESTSNTIGFSHYEPDTGWYGATVVGNSNYPPTVGSDSISNGYIIFGDSSTIRMLYYDHQVGNTGIRDLYVGGEPIHHPNVLDRIHEAGRLIWTEGSSPPYTIKFLAFGPGSDTIPPHFLITHPETVDLGDSCIVTVEPDEPLAQAPLITIGPDTLTVVDTIPGMFLATFNSSGYQSGAYYFHIEGRDRSGNLGRDSSVITIALSDTTLFEERGIFIWPSPGDDEINLHYRFHEATKVVLELFTITGRRIEKFEFEAQGEVDGDYEIEADQFGNGLYLFRMKATGLESGREKTKIGRFAIVH